MRWLLPALLALLAAAAGSDAGRSGCDRLREAARSSGIPSTASVEAVVGALPRHALERLVLEGVGAGCVGETARTQAVEGRLAAPPPSCEGDGSVTGPLSAELEAEWADLAAVYEATNGDEWYDNSCWQVREPVPVCNLIRGKASTWKGVDCHKRGGGRVAKLSLQRNGLTGRVPRSLGALTALQFFDASENGISGELPPSGWPNVTTAALTYSLALNRVEGVLPQETVSVVSADAPTSSLYLDLSSNFISGGIHGFSGWQTGTTIVLSHNPLGGTLAPDSLVGNNLTTGIFQQSLELAGVRLSGTIPANWAGLSETANIISLSDNRLSGSIPPLDPLMRRYDPFDQSLVELDLYVRRRHRRRRRLACIARSRLTPAPPQGPETSSAGPCRRSAKRSPTFSTPFS